MAIISNSEYKAYKGISASTYDAQLTVIIPAAQSMVEQWCGRVFDTATFTETFNGNDWSRIVVKNTPITTLTSVSTIAPDATTEAYDSDSYTFDAESGVIGFQPASDGVLVSDGWESDESPIGQWVTSPQFPAGFENIQVVYVGGYSAGTMPTGLKLAMYQLVDVLLSQALRGPASGAFKSESLGDYSYTLMDGEAIGSQAMMGRLFGQWRRVIA